MSNPMEINGGVALAMAGEGCVAIACDLRMGMQSVSIANNFEKVFPMGDAFVALTGLATDVQTLATEFRKRTNLFELREERKMSPQKLSHLVSSTLYGRRFGPYFVGPIVAGLDKGTGEPYITSFDAIGTIEKASDFVVVGTASDQLLGMCESLYEPNLKPDDLFETISQALMSGMDRDALSGWGAIVYIIEPGQVTRRVLKTRQD